MNEPKFFNIFSKGKENLIKIKPKIIADYREKNSLVIPELIGLGIDVEIKELKVGDFLVGETAIERKTIDDFLSSMKNKRLIKQIEEIKQYQNKLIIIEGIYEKELYNDHEEGINGNAIRGFILSIILKHKIPIIFSKDYSDTAKFISVLAKKKEKEVSFYVKKIASNKKEQMQFILEGFRGIGPSTARKLLEKFKTLENIFKEPIEKLEEVIGKKAQSLKIIKEEY